MPAFLAAALLAAAFLAAAFLAALAVSWLALLGTMLVLWCVPLGHFPQVALPWWSPY